MIDLLFDVPPVQLLSPVAVALVYISVCSFIAEPHRRNFNAIMIAGAGAAYLNGGFGAWEFAFTILVTYCAFKGLQSYAFIGVGWLLHTGWDVMHHLYGNPIIPFVEGDGTGADIWRAAVRVLGLSFWKQWRRGCP